MWGPSINQTGKRETRDLKLSEDTSNQSMILSYPSIRSAIPLSTVRFMITGEVWSIALHIYSCRVNNTIWTRSRKRRHLLISSLIMPTSSVSCYQCRRYGISVIGMTRFLDCTRQPPWIELVSAQSMLWFHNQIYVAQQPASLEYTWCQSIM